VKGHVIFKCDRFLGMDIEKRWNWVTQSKACFCCLRKGHQASTCKSTKLCEKNGCGKKHNNLLHKDLRNETTNSNEPTLHTIGPARLGKKVLLRIAPVVLRGPSGEIKTYALFDEGSTVTMIDSSIAKKLGLKGEPDPLSLQWTNDLTQEDSRSKRVSLEISAESKEEFYTINNARTKEMLSLPIQTVNYKRMMTKWGHLKKIELKSMSEAQPMILIGQDHSDLTIARQVIEGPKNSPMLSRSKLGWVVHGNVATIKGRVDPDFSFQTCDQDETLHLLVKEYWKTETFGVKVTAENPRSRDDIKAQTIFEKTTQLIDGRYETGLLWKDADLKLPESKNITDPHSNY